MERRIKVVVTDTVQLTERVIDFFKQSGFKLTGKKDGYLKFEQKSSLLDAWKTNPLKWGAEIFVSIVDNTVLANFYVDTDAQMKTNEEETVWMTFIDSFQNYLTNGKIYSQKLASTISDNKKSRLSYFSWTILGALIGGLLSLLYSKLTGNTLSLSIYLIPVLATLFLSWRINYVKTNNAQ
jgi:hypothetical protein